EFHASAVTIHSDGSAIVAILQGEIGNAGRSIGNRTDVFIDGHHHVDAVWSSRVIGHSSGLDNRSALAGADDVERVVHLQGAKISGIVSGAVTGNSKRVSSRWHHHGVRACERIGSENGLAQTAIISDAIASVRDR